MLSGGILGGALGAWRARRGAKHGAKHERTVLRSKNKGTKCTFVVSEPQHQLWVQWGMCRPRRGNALILLIFHLYI